jgi:hypothetical protein
LVPKAGVSLLEASIARSVRFASLRRSKTLRTKFHGRTRSTCRRTRYDLSSRRSGLLRRRHRSPCRTPQGTFRCFRSDIDTPCSNSNFTSQIAEPGFGRIQDTNVIGGDVLNPRLQFWLRLHHLLKSVMLVRYYKQPRRVFPEARLICRHRTKSRSRVQLQKLSADRIASPLRETKSRQCFAESHSSRIAGLDICPMS